MGSGSTRWGWQLNAFNRRLERACDEIRGASSGRNDTTFGQARFVGKALHWSGADRYSAETRLADAAASTGLSNSEARSAVRNGLRKGSKDAKHEEPQSRGNSDLIRPRREYRHNERVETLQRADLASVWDSLQPVSSDPIVAAWLQRRGIDPGIVERADLARVLPADTPIDALPHRAMKRMGITWVESGHRLIFRVFDVNGRLVNLKARADLPDGAPEKAKKSLNLALGEGSCSAAIEACPTVRALLAGRAWAVEAIRRRGLVVVEGEWDYLTHAQRTDGPVVIGLWSGAWTQAIADRIPDGTRVYLRPHNDVAGHRYMRKVAESLYGRCNVYAPPLPEWKGDDNDRLQAGTLPAHPRDDSDPYFVVRNGGFVPAILPVDKDSARAELRSALARLRATLTAPEKHGRKTLIWGNTGVGKTYATVRMAIRAWCDGRTIRWLCREDKFITETLKGLEEAARQLHNDGDISDSDRAGFLRALAGAIDTGRNQRNCDEYHERVLPASRVTPMGGGIVCGACPHSAKCSTRKNGYLRRQARRDTESRFSIATHAIEVLRGGAPVDLLIVDEDPSGALLTEETFSARDLAKWFKARDLGDMTEEAKNTLLGVIADSEVEGARPRKLDPSILAGVDLGDTYNASDAARDTLRNDPDLLKATHDAIKKGAPFRALEALRNSARHGFKGCRVEHGTVVVQRRQTLRRKAHTTLVLDATATPRRARALLGHSLRFIAIRCESERTLKVTHTTGWTASKFNLLDPEKHKDSWRRLNEICDYKVDDKTLVVTTKPIFRYLRSMGDDAPTWFLRANAPGHVIYYGQAGSSGSNVHRDCVRVIALPFWVPQAVRESRAELLADMSGVELRTKEGWSEEATFELEVARVIQAVGRARQLEALIIMGGNRTLGFEPDESPHVDLYAWRECYGSFSSVACLDEWTRQIVASRGGCSVLTARSIGGAYQGAVLDPKVYMGRTQHVGTPTAEQVLDALRNHHDGDSEAWALGSGLGGIKVNTSTGHLWLAFTAEHERVDTPEGKRPTTETIRRSLLAYAPGLKWFQLPGTEERIETADPIAAYDDAIQRMARDGEALGRRALARVSGVPLTTVSRHMGRHNDAFNERYRLAVEEVARLARTQAEEASKPRRTWKSPKVETVDLRARARSRVRDRVPPKWHSFLQEHGYLIGRLPASRGAPPRWEPRPGRVQLHDVTAVA